MTCVGSRLGQLQFFIFAKLD